MTATDVTVTAATTASKIGDRVQFEQITSYHQGTYANHYRPTITTRIVVGTVTKVIAWMDNSTDVIVLTDEGETVKTQVEAPHGDICF